ncbi:MAG TPA: hypothetical protein VJM10_03950 [Candidatus Methylomirabilis sp.]|nr:hypothetical protein [Candidatus Methylomirabilis sp.]
MTTLTVGQTTTVPVAYTLKWDMLRKGMTWFSWQGGSTGNVMVTV